MTERMERLLAEAIETKRPVLINPTDDDIRRAAEELRQAGRLICTVCRKPIHDEDFICQRITFSERLQAVAQLHRRCESALKTDIEERSGREHR